MYRANWKTLIMPKDVRVVEQGADGAYARFVCEPLMKGYGITLGNSLRRILISSLRGAAVIGVKIKGYEHEFATIPGIKEDVVDIILNIKQIRFVAHEDKLHTLLLRKNVKGTVTAADIVETAGMKILNKDLVLFEMDEGVDFEMELIVGIGRGYVPSEAHNQDIFSEGYIAVDSFFSPVVRANYKVTNARVKNSFDFDKLVFDLETDGSLSPRDALAYAAMILREHTKFFISFSIDEKDELNASDSNEEVNMNLYKTIDELDLSVRSYNCLKNANIRFIGELVKRSEAEMLKTKNFGRKSLNEIKILLIKMGLHFGMEIDNFPDQKIIEQIEKKSGSKI
ncbi:MAG TPA: DNA-directed RNA polymerase subunit alpha [bacterium]|jgi:DNA-directed RNA polymerase subunit alpha|nr:DNA-directed RNA polymerase subunit alpha [bacterium]